MEGALRHRVALAEAQTEHSCAAGAQEAGNGPYSARITHESCVGRMISAMTSSIDSTDQHILALLRSNARASISQIAHVVGLSSAPVSRRIERMERDGVIRGYTALVDDHLAGSVEAFTEVRLAGGIETGELSDIVRAVPEVQEFYTIAGDPDALVRLRVDDVDHLQRVVNALRRTGKLTGTKTLIVMHAWRRSVAAISLPTEQNRRSD